MNSRVLVLGAGIAGLGAGYILGRDGAVVVDARDRYGGLCDNFTIQGFRFDHAVHLSFTTSEVVRSIFDKTPYIAHRPNPFNYFKEVWLKHPVQNNLFGLPVDFKVRAIRDFIEREKIQPADSTLVNANYFEWLRSRYGEFMAHEFFDLYTRKYWCMDPIDMEIDWISNRLYQPQLEEVLHGAMTPETPNTYYASEVRYPHKGGYRSFLDPLLQRSEILLKKKAVLIDITNKYVDFEDGSKIYFESIISSIPLPELIKLIKDAPFRIKEAANQLRATSLVITSIGFKRESIPKHLWFYIYDEDMLPARAHSPSIKSPDNAPAGCGSLQFETYFSCDRPLSMSLDHLSEHIENLVVRIGLAEKNEVLFIDNRVIQYGNVMFDHRLRSRRTLIREYLAQVGVESVGRFGEWDYLWSDQSLLSGMGAATRLQGCHR